MASYSRDQAVRRTAGRQRTLVTTEQLTDCGLQKDAVAHRVKGGWLHLVFHGVYTVGCGELPPLARERAAGFDVLHFTRSQVVNDPERVLVILAQALARAKSD